MTNNRNTGDLGLGLGLSILQLVFGLLFLIILPAHSGML